MRVIIAILACILLPFATVAATMTDDEFFKLGATPEPAIPAYQTDESCAKHMRGSGHREPELTAMMNDCIRSEQASYDALKIVWYVTPPSGRLRCMYLYGGPDDFKKYTFILGCVNAAYERFEREHQTLEKFHR